MKEYRMDKKTTEHYTSFEDLAKAFGCRAVNKQTKDKNKLAEQQEKFRGRHLCKACKTPMTYVGGNQMVCANESCKGLKVERESKEGEKVISYVTSYELLDKKGAEIAYNIFS